MKFQLIGDWPVGQWCVPAGTFIDGVRPQWNGIALPMPMPINALPLDQDAYDHMAKHYDYHRIITRDPAINRHADLKPEGEGNA